MDIRKKYPVKIMKFEDKNYPADLKIIRHPPKQLYYRGDWQNQKFKKVLAMVGSRRVTQYGRVVIDKLLAQLVPNGYTIVSGFMYGADTLAHQGCLEYQGITIAVLGSGLDVIYPPENEQLYVEILAKGGLVLSEYEPEVKPQLWTFPQRNRIVAGLATDGVVVIEADDQSGSLITAKLAHNQGRKVYAVPGPITSQVSRGTNQLIKSRLAEMVMGAEDIMGKIGQNLSLFGEIELTKLEHHILQALANENLSSDQLARITKESISQISQTLTMLGLKGLIKEDLGKYYLS